MSADRRGGGGSGTVPAGGGVTGRRVVVVSPHFDDVPLSLGQSLRDGALSAADVEVRVVFGRTNWTTRVHPTPGRARWVSLWRRAEEALAARRFGYRVGTADLEEVILRTGELDAESFRSGGDPRSDPVFPAVRELLDGWSGTTGEMWVPAGLGLHLDHRLVAFAAADLVRAGLRCRVAFYEDRPYVSHLSGEEVTAQLDELDLDLRSQDVSGPVTAAVQASVRRLYRSQMDGYFHLAQAADLDSGACERIWRPVATSYRSVAK